MKTCPPFKLYTVTLKHDHGTVNIKTNAKNIHDAIDKACTAENAPTYAVIAVREVKR